MKAILGLAVFVASAASCTASGSKQPNDTAVTSRHVPTSDSGVHPVTKITDSTIKISDPSTRRELGRDSVIQPRTGRDKKGRKVPIDTMR